MVAKIEEDPGIQNTESILHLDHEAHITLSHIQGILCTLPIPTCFGQPIYDIKTRVVDCVLLDMDNDMSYDKLRANNAIRQR